jgi:hypothetical protein
MKTWTWLLVSVVVGAAGISAVAGARGGARAEKLAKSLHGLTWSVGDAIRAAEAKTGGKAVGSEVEAEKGKAVVEVLILKEGDPQKGTAPQLLEVEVDGSDNSILEIEEEDDGDDGEESDGEDDNDGGEDDDE